MTAYRSVVIDSLVQTVTTNLAKMNNSSSVYELNGMVTSLEGFSDNFHIGLLSLHHCFDEISHILVISIAKYLAEIE